ncbi:MAG TPA: regulatory protein RecX [Actinotalea sp.]|nr:regulatory protein RecX [Actinotalea sp.]
MDPEPDPEQVARTIALRQLAAAPRSRSQLARAMAARGVDATVAEAVLDRFTQVGLIDDAEYAQMLVRSRRESRGLARRALAVELRRKGIGEQDAERALATVDDEAEESSARELLLRRWRSGPGVDPTAQARRAIAMLGRKGYPAALASRLVREMVDDRGALGGDLIPDDVD